MYDDAYTIQWTAPEDVRNFNYVAGMVPFLFNLIEDVSFKSLIVFLSLSVLSLFLGVRVSYIFTRPYILYEESIRLSLCICLSVCVCFQRFLSDDRSPLLMNLWSRNLVGR